MCMLTERLQILLDTDRRVLAATAARVTDGVLVSTDRAFRSVDALRVLDPADDAFIDDLRAGA